MKTEDFVSLEVAKLLKEKGYHEPCNSAYDRDGRIWDSKSGDKDYNEKYMWAFSRPTLYEAAKWLREKGLFIEIYYYNEDYYMYDILTIPEHDLIGLSDRPYIKYKSYEEVLNAGILEALKLI